MYYKTDICDLCSEQCREAYWIEIICKSGEKKDYFVCEECYINLNQMGERGSLLANSDNNKN